MFASKIFSFLLVSVVCVESAWSTPKTTRWPVPDWTSLEETQPATYDRMMGSKACQDFLDFAVRSPHKDEGMNTEGIVVIKDGQLVYEYYDGAYHKDTPHQLWSISKTLTATLLGTAVYEGKVSLDEKVSDYFPAKDWRKNLDGEDLYNQIRLSDLFYYGAGFDWQETPNAYTWRASILNMLYSQASGSMLSYALNAPLLPDGPGKKFVYSSGNAMIFQGVLRKAYGETEYKKLPWTHLFNPLGIRSAVFEKDGQGLYVGGAYVFMTPRDLAKVGYLYLNGGVWNGKRILSKAWMKQFLTLSPALLNEWSLPDHTSQEGVAGGTIWLNKPMPDGKPLLPNLPQDLFFGSGRFGQWLLVFPSQRLVIARNGYDQQYVPKLDRFGRKAMRCFAPQAEAKLPPEVQTGPAPDPNNYLKMIADVNYTTSSGFLSSAIAKEVCSCHYVAGLDIYKQCLSRTGIPPLVFQAVAIEQTHSGPLKILKAGIFNGQRPKKPWATAVYDETHPEYGCRLLESAVRKR